MIPCPNCQRVSVRRATPDEVLPILKYLNEYWGFSFDRDEDNTYLLVCDECGWFNTLRPMRNAESWQKKIKASLSRTKKRLEKKKVT